MSNKVAVVMGSKSDWTTMQAAVEILQQMGVDYHTEVVSAHRTPQKLATFAEAAVDNVQMPKGIAVGTLAIGTAGAFNAGLLACQILALNDSELAARIEDFRYTQTQSVLDNPDPSAE